MLNKEQQEAVQSTTQPTLLIAGPGTGKTTVICEKVRSLVEKEGINPQEILALTFTEKAAEEMSLRIDEHSTHEPFQARTFHAFALELLEEFHEHIPEIDQGFVLLDEANSLLYFFENMDEFKFSSIEVKNNTSQIAYEIRSTISKLKDFGVTLKEMEKLEFPSLQTKIDVLTIYSKYEQYKAKHNFVDFGDLLLYAKQLLEQHPQIRTELQKRFKYVLVDEFQDTNKIQLEFLTLLADKNLTVVGDEKQSIYSFRGANYDNFKLIEEYFSDLKELYLKHNYRSSKEVLDVVNTITSHIGTPQEKLDPHSQEKGNVEVIESYDEFAQAHSLIKRITNLKEKNPNCSIAFLTRRKYELHNLAKHFRDANIPHTLVQATPLFNHELIKELLFILQITLSPKEANQELFSLLFSSGLRHETIKKISREASRNEKSIYNVLKKKTEHSEFTVENELVSQFVEKLDHLIKLVESKVSLRELVYEIFVQFEMYTRAEVSKDQTSIHHLNAFLRFTEQFVITYKTHNLRRFLQICDLSKSLNIEIDPQEAQGTIQLMTYHQAKGKEFDIVFLPNLNDKRFPTPFKQQLFPTPFDISRDEFIQEEKRLFFVGCSRAKQELHISYVQKFSEHKLLSRPSPLLSLLPKDLEKVKEDKQQFSYQLSSKEYVKKEILSRIERNIIADKFDLAKKDIELLSQLFSSSTTLKQFIDTEHPDLVSFKEKLKDTTKEPVEIDTSKFEYSVSQLETYTSCPKKYLYSYIYKVPTKPKHYFDFGTSMHTIFEFLIDDIEKGVSEDQLFDKGMKLMQENWISKAYENVNQEKEYLDKGTKAIKEFIQTELVLRKQKRETIQKEDRFLIDFEGKKIQGIIDRVDKTDKGYEIIDYKTSNYMYSEKDLQDNLQLYVYAQALKKNPKYKQEPYNVALWYLVHNKIVSVESKDLNKEQLKEKVLSTISEIEKKNFKAKPSFFSCKYCDFNTICPSAKR